MRKSFVVLLLLLSSATARADWLEASTDHFVIYGETSERNMRRFAEQLERFDGAMSAVSGIPRTKPTRSARVTVYIVGSDQDLRKLYAQNGDDARNIGGFYSPRLEGPVAFVPRVLAARSGDSDLDFSTIVLLHEYAHHFTLSNSRFTPPRWLTEGSAEFFASAGFASDGSVTLGRPANHRAPELFRAPDVTVIDLVDQDHYEKRKGKDRRYDAYYGRAWLLFHYLTFEPARRGQLAAYVKALTTGTPSRQAAESAFGDLVKLDREIDSYMTRRSLQILTIKGSALPTGEIATRVLRPGEAAVMPVVMRSKRGVGSEETARSIVADARAVAARFPADAAVLAALAEAEHDAGNDDAAIAAADAALAIDPANVNAHLRKGYALFDKARRSRNETAMRDARRAFVALNRVENDHPVPLYRFYLSHVSIGAEPTANAIAALEQASGIAPYAREVSLALAHRRLVEGRFADARIALQPIAFNPHGGPLSAKTREFMQLIDAAAEAGDTSTLAGQLRSLVSADDGDEAGPGASDGPVKPAGEP